MELDPPRGDVSTTTGEDRASRRGRTHSAKKASTARPLAEMTAFATRRGLTLLYEPGPFHEWTGRDVQQ